MVLLGTAICIFHQSTDHASLLPTLLLSSSYAGNMPIRASSLTFSPLCFRLDYLSGNGSFKGYSYENVQYFNFHLLSCYTILAEFFFYNFFFSLADTASSLRWNSWKYNFVEVSGHNLEISQTWGFYHRFCLSTKYYTWTNLSFLYWLIILYGFLIISETIEVVWFSVRFSFFRCHSNFYGEKMHVFLKPE